MFHIVKDIYATIQKQEEYSVLVLGLEGAGKSTLIEKLKEMYLFDAKGQPVIKGQRVRITPPERITPTVGQNVTTLKLNKVLLKFWDLGGGEAVRAMWANYYAQCHCILLVVDGGGSRDLRALQRARDAFKNITQDPATRDLFDHRSIPVLLLANKQDYRSDENQEDPLAGGAVAPLEESVSDPEEGDLGLQDRTPIVEESGVELFQLKETFNEVFESLNAIDSKIVLVSAHTGYGLRQAMDWLTLRLTRNKKNNAPNYK